MKLFLYYSYTSNGDIVSEYMSNNGYDVYKITTLKNPIPKSFFWGMMIGGFKAMTNAKPKINKIDINLDNYDEIIIGSPIWNGRLATPINTVLKELDLSNKNVSFMLYSGSGEGKNALKKLNKLYPNRDITFLKEPKKYKEELEKLKLS